MGFSANREKIKSLFIRNRIIYLCKESAEFCYSIQLFPRSLSHPTWFTQQKSREWIKSISNFQINLLTWHNKKNLFKNLILQTQFELKTNKWSIFKFF